MVFSTAGGAGLYLPENQKISKLKKEELQEFKNKISDFQIAQVLKVKEARIFS